jgi:hypothetical protein
VALNGDRKKVDFAACVISTGGVLPATASEPECLVPLVGKILDRVGNAVTTAVVVKVTGPSTRTATTSTGSYRLDLKPGQYKVTARDAAPAAPNTVRTIYCEGKVKPCKQDRTITLKPAVDKPSVVDFRRVTVCDETSFSGVAVVAETSAGEGNATTPINTAGGKLFGNGQRIQVRLAPRSELSVTFESTLWIVSPRVVKVGQNLRDASKVFTLPAFPKGQEILLQLCVHDTLDGKDYVFTSGPASRNEDNLIHVKMIKDKPSKGWVKVKWEDTYHYDQRPDDDFNEFIAYFRGLPLDGKISGVVRKLDGKGGFVPAAGVQVKLDGDEKTSTRTNANGRYEFKELEIGNYTVSVPKGYCREPFSVNDAGPDACKSQAAVKLDGEHPAADENFEQESYAL